MLKDSVSDKPCQKDEKQVRPFRNSLIRSAGAFRLGLVEPVGRAVIQCFNVAQFRVKFHFNTPTRREIAPFLVIEYRRLVWPLLLDRIGEMHGGGNWTVVGHFSRPALEFAPALPCTSRYPHSGFQLAVHAEVLLRWR